MSFTVPLFLAIFIVFHSFCNCPTKTEKNKKNSQKEKQRGISEKYIYIYFPLSCFYPCVTKSGFKKIIDANININPIY